MPKVSVIVPIYNVEKYLRECLDSIVNQTFKDIEILCVDDGSIDNSLEILKEYANNDDRFILLKQTNQGAAIARNYGMSVARGKYLLFLDSDDVFDRNLLEKAVAKAEVFNADVTVFRAVSFDTNNGKFAEMNDDIANLYCDNKACFSYINIPDKIFNSFLNPAWNKLVRRTFIKSNKILFQDVKRCNDLLFSSKVLVMADRIVLLNEVLLYYRVGMNSNLQSGNDKTPLEFYKALSELKKFLDEKELYRCVEKSFLKLAIDNIFYNINTLKELEIRNTVISKLRNEGFHFLGIEKFDGLRQLTFTGWLQYKFVCKSNNIAVMNILYTVHKIWEYYKLTGLKNTVYKIVLRS